LVEFLNVNDYVDSQACGGLTYFLQDEAEMSKFIDLTPDGIVSTKQQTD